MDLAIAIGDALKRMDGYPWWEVALELALIALVVWAIIRFIEGTRAAGVMKGLVALLLIGLAARLFLSLVGREEAFERLGYLLDRAGVVVAIGLVVVFQPELRRALTRLGEAPIFRSTPGEIAQVVDAVVEACSYFQKAKFGALIVMERRTALGGLAEGGTRLGAEVSARLLQSLFFPGTALHDLAVIIKGPIVHAAGVQLPLAGAADMPDAGLGSRHRAAVGISRECDALVVIVSEETGSIRIAERGKLTDPMTPEELRRAMMAGLTKELPDRPSTAEEARKQQASDAPAPKDGSDA
ncbi:MAG: diadenylate cyclase [Phycisphaera sp.]|nr:MAG: diadenylate cyclase [Phycisphaera sp.]